MKYLLSLLLVVFFSFFFPCIVSAQPENRILKNDVLWEALHKDLVRKYGKLPEIKVYSANDKYSEILFILDKGGMYIYKENTPQNTLRPIIHAKAIFYSAINRITFVPSDTGGYYMLWYNNKIELQVGG